MDSLSYYSRSEIKREIAFNAQKRETSAMYGIGKFGRRPDVIQFENDVLEFARSGATSFHISEEHWSNALDLQPGMPKKELDKIRTGWDLVLDIDSPDLEDSKKITHYLIEAIKFHDVKYIPVKYSGNKGFHIAIPFKSFPSKVNEIDTVNLFPDGPKAITEYLVDMITKPLIEAYGEGMRDKIEVDTVLISNRHMFRAAYSMHEKSGLVSLPILPEQVLTFDRRTATPEKINPEIRFLDDSKVMRGEATALITQAFDWHSRNAIRKEDHNALPKKTKEYDEITEAIPEEFFAPCIKKGLEGIEDGRKRFLFILINFLRSVGWNMGEVEGRVMEWNKGLGAPLKEGYVISQLSWHRANKKKVLPPNYLNKAYYADIGILPEETIANKFKNPVNYTVSMFKFKNSKKKKRKKKDSKHL
jgi:hypothetical protein